MSKELKFVSVVLYCSTIFLGAEIGAVTEHEVLYREYYDSLKNSGVMETTPLTKFVASIRRFNKSTSYAEHHICTGVIISVECVLTAASCLFDDKLTEYEPEELYVVLGITYGSMYDPLARSVNVATIRSHQKYDPDTLANNIALIFLNSTITESDVINFAPIAKTRPSHYESCTVLGFGVVYYKKVKISQVIFTDLSVWPKDICSKFLRLYDKAESQLFCAGSEQNFQAGICTSLASEPLLCNDVLYGISVLNIGCKTESDFTAVFIDVWKHNKWINRNVWELEVFMDSSLCLQIEKFILRSCVFLSLTLLIFPFVLH